MSKSVPSISLDDIQEAAKNLTGVIKETRLFKSDMLSAEYDAEIFIKPENQQRTGAFKIRGAYNKICSLTQKERENGIVAASAGNHAQGVALAARLACDQTGVCPRVTIVMPETTPYIKVEGTRKLGAVVVLAGDTYDDAYAKALEIADTSGAIFVHPFDDQKVIAGQGTIGLEIFDQCTDADVVIVPVGGGGLIAGVATAIKEVSPRCEVIGVEPEGAASMKASLEAGTLVTLPTVSTIADGVAVKRCGVVPFELCKMNVDSIVTVADPEINEALLVLIEREKMVCETAGALGVAALAHLDLAGKKVVVVVSGGNIDVITMSEMLNRGMISRGRLFSFGVELHHKPGELVKVATLLADLKANVIKLDHNQFHNPRRFKSVRLDVTVEANGQSHVDEIIGALNSQGYVLDIKE